MQIPSQSQNGVDRRMIMGNDCLMMRKSAQRGGMPSDNRDFQAGGGLLVDQLDGPGLVKVTGERAQIGETWKSPYQVRVDRHPGRNAEETGFA